MKPAKKAAGSYGTGAIATGATITLANPGAGIANVIYRIVVSFSVAPLTAQLTIDDNSFGASTFFVTDLPLAAGVHTIDLKPGIYGLVNQDTVVTVIGTGASTVYLNVVNGLI